MLLLGNVQHALDDKNRIRLPAKYREKLGNEYILMPGSAGCIYVYPSEAEEKFVRVVEEISELDPEHAEWIRSLTEFAAVVEADTQGRFMLPPDLIKIADIKKDIRIIGTINKVEIWSEERYQQRLENKKQSGETYDDLYTKFHQAMSKK